MFNVKAFYKDYHIPITERGKHVRPDWVNVDCPLCGMSGGLGVYLPTGAVKCWGCGKRGMISVIMALLNVDFPTAKDIHKEYTETEHRTERILKPIQARKSVCLYPTNTGPLSDRHKAYLSDRGFDPDELEKVWGLKGTNHLGDYKFRIVAPVMFGGVMVSYQCRDITGKSSIPWKACKQCDEVVDHQTILDGLDYVKHGVCVVVEGRADMWRLGKGAVCIFGISWTLPQANLLAERMRKVFILFDPEDEAQRQAARLGALLNGRGVEVEILDMSDTTPDMLVEPGKKVDLGNLKQEFADEIRRELGFN